jgi:hypothetical protein
MKLRYCIQTTPLEDFQLLYFTEMSSRLTNAEAIRRGLISPREIGESTRLCLHDVWTSEEQEQQQVITLLSLDCQKDGAWQDTSLKEGETLAMSTMGVDGIAVTGQDMAMSTMEAVTGPDVSPSGLAVNGEMVTGGDVLMGGMEEQDEKKEAVAQYMRIGSDAECTTDGVQQEGVAVHKLSEPTTTEAPLYVPDLMSYVTSQGTSNNEVTVLIPSLAPDGSVQYQPLVVQIANKDAQNMPNFDTSVKDSASNGHGQEMYPTVTVPNTHATTSTIQDGASAPAYAPCYGDLVFQNHAGSSTVVTNVQDGGSQTTTTITHGQEIDFQMAFDMINEDMETETTE